MFFKSLRYSAISALLLFLLGFKVKINLSHQQSVERVSTFSTVI